MAYYRLIVIYLGVLSGCFGSGAETWELVFYDPGSADWADKWFLEGEKASVKNTPDGMLFSAGPEPGDDASHAVLWTSQSFSGDVRIEYRYTRLDTMMSVDAVTILYIHATGLGMVESPTDIALSSWRRSVPAMTEYYLYMTALQISYATTGPVRSDYVSARQYPAESQQSFPTETQIPPVYEDVGLFEVGETYRVTAVKEDTRLSFTVEGEDGIRKFEWDTTGFLPLEGGRIGLRHMWARSALYSDFRVYVKN
jgi:hypothetical protein